jgi:Flp pilus assembly protein TadD
MLTTKNRLGKNLGIFLTAVLLLSACAPRGPRLLLEGEQLIREGKYTLAIEKLTAATSVMATNALAWNYLGLACQHAGRPVEAEKAYLRALQLNRDLAEVRYNLGCLWLDQNKLEAAKSELTAYTLRRGNSPEGLLKLGTAQLRLRELNNAERSFADGFKLDAQNPDLLNGLGLVRLQRGRYVEAAQFFAGAVRVRTNHGPALMNLAVVSHLYLKDKPAALRRYRECLALKPPPANAENLAAVIVQLEQELAPPAAPSRPTNVVAQVTTNPPAPAAAATNLAALKPPTTNGGPAAPPSPVAPANPSRLSSPPKVEVAATPVKVTAPATSNPPIVKTIPAVLPPPKPQPAVGTAPPPAVVETVKLSPDPVLQPARDGAAPDPSQPANAFVSPVVVTSSVPREMAVAKPSKRGLLRSLNPLNLLHSDSKTPGRLTPVPATMPQPEAVVDQPAAPPPPTFARYKYRSPAKPPAGNRAAAQPLFAEALRAHQQQRWPEAIQGYRAALRSDPSHFEACYNLGLACIRGGELPAALAAYENALALQPGSLDAQYNFALALKQANYIPDSVSELEQILARQPKEVRAHLELGNLYDQQLRRPSKAREHYQKVLELEPAHPQAENIRYWLAVTP